MTKKPYSAPKLVELTREQATKIALESLTVEELQELKEGLTPEEKTGSLDTFLAKVEIIKKRRIPQS